MAKALITSSILLFGFLVGCSKPGSESGTPTPKVASPPKESGTDPQLRNVWMQRLGNLGWFVVEYENVGQKAIKAFEGEWVVIDELDNVKVSRPVIFTSETLFITNEGVKNGHAIAPGEHICLVAVLDEDGETRTFATTRESAHAGVRTTPEGFNGFLVHDKIKSVISKVVNAE